MFSFFPFSYFCYLFPFFINGLSFENYKDYYSHCLSSIEVNIIISRELSEIIRNLRGSFWNYPLKRMRGQSVKGEVGDTFPGIRHRQRHPRCLSPAWIAPGKMTTKKREMEEFKRQGGHRKDGVLLDDVMFHQITWR